MSEWGTYVEVSNLFLECPVGVVGMLAVLALLVHVHGVEERHVVSAQSHRSFFMIDHHVLSHCEHVYSHKLSYVKIL